MKIILALDVGHFSERVSDLTWFSAFVPCGSGRVLNLFAKDIGVMDVVLPWTFVDAWQVLRFFLTGATVGQNYSLMVLLRDVLYGNIYSQGQTLGVQKSVSSIM